MRSAAARFDPDAALRALANPSRRRALELVSGRARTSGDIAAKCGWTKPAASQQLKLLRDVGLVEVRVHGNQRLYSARAERLAELRAYLDAFWTERMGLLARDAGQRRR
jgi:DNA-binding transcriptional ArsR family regulator